MTREDAIKGLRSVADWHYGKYEQTHEEDYLNDGDFLTAVANMLKEQEPRVMTLGEVKSLERDAVVWYEHSGVNKQRPRIVEQVYDSGIIFTDGGHWRFNADAYGKNFRLWTSRPTEAEREAIPWRS